VGVNFMVLTEQFTGKLLAHEFEWKYLLSCI
jgi:hypothetical protein